jgi:hypothetical protein
MHTQYPCGKWLPSRSGSTPRRCPQPTIHRPPTYPHPTPKTISKAFPLVEWTWARPPERVGATGITGTWFCRVGSTWRMCGWTCNWGGPGGPSEQPRWGWTWWERVGSAGGWACRAGVDLLMGGPGGWLDLPAGLDLVGWGRAAELSWPRRVGVRPLMDWAAGGLGPPGPGRPLGGVELPDGTERAGRELHQPGVGPAGVELPG